MARFHLFLDNIKSVPVYLLKVNGHLARDKDGGHTIAEIGNFAVFCEK